MKQMDSESECSGSVPESVEDNDEVGLETTTHVVNGVNCIKNDDGSCGIEMGNSVSSPIIGFGSLDLDGKKGDAGPLGPVVTSPGSGTGSPGVPQGSPPPGTVKKGHGLRKWRRIKRDFARDSSPVLDNGGFVKEASLNLDTNKILKRASSSSAIPARPQLHHSVETNQASEGSVGSVNMLPRNSVPEYLSIPSSSLDSAALGSGFSVGLNSEENSEDQSSKSSTAASAPRLRYDPAMVAGNPREGSKVKNLSAKGMGNSTQRGQQGKGKISTSKKTRGERIEKENSHSSMESDSRSSNFVFLQGASSSAASNGKHIGRLSDHDGLDSDEGHESGLQFSEEHQTGYHGNNIGPADLSQDDFAAGSSCEGKEVVSENHQPSTDQDQLSEAVHKLRSVKEALDKEVRLFGEIGRGIIPSVDTTANGSSPHFTNVDPELCEPSSSDQLHSEGVDQNGSYSSESQVYSLKQTVVLLESKLTKALVMLKEKGSRVDELEAALNSGRPQMGGSENSTVDLQSQRQIHNEIETEVEALLKQKIEAEVKYLAIKQMSDAVARDHEALLESQKAVSKQQAEWLNKLREAESKIAVLKKQAEDWEADVEIVEVMRMEKRVCRVTSCLFIQFISLAVILGLLILRSPSRPAVVVPT